MSLWGKHLSERLTGRLDFLVDDMLAALADGGVAGIARGDVEQMAAGLAAVMLESLRETGREAREIYLETTIAAFAPLPMEQMVALGANLWVRIPASLLSSCPPELVPAGRDWLARFVYGWLREVMPAYLANRPLDDRGRWR